MRRLEDRMAGRLHRGHEGVDVLVLLDPEAQYDARALGNPTRRPVRARRSLSSSTVVSGAVLVSSRWWSAHGTTMSATSAPRSS